MDNLFWIGFVGAALALIFAYLQKCKVMKCSEGDEKMVKIASSIRAGANAYLKQQYSTVAKVFAVVFVILLIIAFASKGQMLSRVTPFAFLTGGIWSMLAGLIGMFNPVWDDNRRSDAAFFEAVTIAGRILEHKWERFRADERMEQQFAELLSAHRERIAAEEKTETMDEKILVLSEFFPCQKQLSATEIAFLVFPSNRGGYCVQPVRKENSSNYKYEFPENWLGLENEALQEVTGLAGASFCHKGGFLLTTETLADAVSALWDRRKRRLCSAPARIQRTS